MSADTEATKTTTTSADTTQNETNKENNPKEAPQVNQAVQTESNDEEIKLLQKIGDRLQFFFSTANLRTDRYMKNQMLSRSDHTIEISNLLRFKTIRALTTSPEKIAKAAETHLSDLVRLNDARDAIGRKDNFEFKPPIEKIHAVTIFVDGFPTEEKQQKYSVTIPDIVEFFKPFGKVTLVRFRFDKSDRKPLGSAFVEFDTVENMKKVLDHEKPFELKGNELKVKSMNSWIEEKEGKKGNGDKSFSDKKRSRDEDGDNDDNIDNDKDGADAAADAKAAEIKIEWEKGCVISLKGLPDGCDREAILGAIKETCESNEMDSNPYVDYSRGQTNGAIRFKKPFEKISDLVSKLQKGDIEICGNKVEGASVLSGEEEEAYWKAFEEFKRKQAKQFALSKHNKRRRSGGGRGGRGGRRR